MSLAPVPRCRHGEPWSACRRCARTASCEDCFETIELDDSDEPIHPNETVTCMKCVDKMIGRAR